MLIDTDIDHILAEQDDELNGILVSLIKEWCHEHDINIQLTFRRLGRKRSSKFVIRFDNSVDLVYFRVGFSTTDSSIVIHRGSIWFHQSEFSVTDLLTSAKVAGSVPPG